MYQHQFMDGRRFPCSPGKAVCVGRNYADHIAELANETPQQPLLFIKSNNAFAELGETLLIPKSGECHNELELAFLIADTLSHASVSQVYEGIAGVGLALDLTLRDVQTALKQKGLPWERAKAFDGSCAVSAFVPVAKLDLQQPFAFTLHVNGELRQNGNSNKMLWPWVDLISHISESFSLLPGDIVLTGTPKGVGELQSGDNLVAELTGHLSCKSQVVRKV